MSNQCEICNQADHQEINCPNVEQKCGKCGDKWHLTRDCDIKKYKTNEACWKGYEDSQDESVKCQFCQFFSKGNPNYVSGSRHCQADNQCLDCQNRKPTLTPKKVIDGATESDWKDDKYKNFCLGWWKIKEGYGNQLWKQAGNQNKPYQKPQKDNGDDNNNPKKINTETKLPCPYCKKSFLSLRTYTDGTSENFPDFDNHYCHSLGGIYKDKKKKDDIGGGGNNNPNENKPTTTNNPPTHLLVIGGICLIIGLMGLFWQLTKKTPHDSN